MSGSEFRTHLAAAGLSVRRAAPEFGVSDRTIHRWMMDQSPIPDDAAAKAIELSGGMSLDGAQAAVLGRLLAVFERVLYPSMPDSYLHSYPLNPAGGIGQLIAMCRATKPERYRAAEDQIEELMGAVAPPIPTRMSLADQGHVWLGYYAQKREARHASE